MSLNSFVVLIRPLIFILFFCLFVFFCVCGFWVSILFFYSLGHWYLFVFVSIFLSGFWVRDFCDFEFFVLLFLLFCYFSYFLLFWVLFCYSLYLFFVIFVISVILLFLIFLLFLFCYFCYFIFFVIFLLFFVILIFWLYIYIFVCVCSCLLWLTTQELSYTKNTLKVKLIYGKDHSDGHLTLKRIGHKEVMKTWLCNVCDEVWSKEKNEWNFRLHKYIKRTLKLRSERKNVIIIHHLIRHKLAENRKEEERGNIFDSAYLRVSLSVLPIKKNEKI